MESLLPTLEPSPGGLARLRAHVGGRSSRDGWRRRLAWAAPLAACLVAAVLWLPPWLAQRRQAAMLVHALRQQVALQSAAGGIRMRHGAAIELPSGQTDVRIYLVQSTAGPSDVDKPRPMPRP